MLSPSEKDLITTTIEHFLDEDNFKDIMINMLEKSGYADVDVRQANGLVEVSGIDDEGDIWTVQMSIGEWIH